MFAILKNQRNYIYFFIEALLFFLCLPCYSCLPAWCDTPLAQDEGQNDVLPPLSMTDRQDQQEAVDINNDIEKPEVGEPVKLEPEIGEDQVIIEEAIDAISRAERGLAQCNSYTNDDGSVTLTIRPDRNEDGVINEQDLEKVALNFSHYQAASDSNMQTVSDAAKGISYMKGCSDKDGTIQISFSVDPDTMEQLKRDPTALLSKVKETLQDIARLGKKGKDVVSTLESTALDESQITAQSRVEELNSLFTSAENQDSQFIQNVDIIAEAAQDEGVIDPREIDRVYGAVEYIISYAKLHEDSIDMEKLASYFTTLREKLFLSFEFHVVKEGINTKIDALIDLLNTMPSQAIVVGNDGLIILRPSAASTPQDAK